MPYEVADGIGISLCRSAIDRLRLRLASRMEGKFRTSLATRSALTGSNRPVPRRRIVPKRLLYAEPTVHVLGDGTNVVSIEASTRASPYKNPSPMGCGRALGATCTRELLPILQASLE